MNLNTRPDRLILKIVPGADGDTSLYEDEGDTEGYKDGAYTTTQINHQGNTVTIMPRKGSFPGMPDQRAYTLEFLAQSQPVSVSVNGQRQVNGTWNYDQQTKIVTVYVPATACDKKIEVSLSF